MSRTLPRPPPDPAGRAGAGPWRRLGQVLVASYLVGLTLFALVLVLGTDFLERLRYLVEPSLGPWPSRHVAEMLAYHRAMDGSVPTGAVIFLGDSITQGLATTAIAPWSVNFGIGHLTARELAAHLDQYRSLERASAVFLMIGINDLAHRGGPRLESDLDALAAALPANKPLVWSAILPTWAPGIDAGRIAAVNRAIATICGRRPGCLYLDTEPAFLAGGEALLRDGLHPNDAGYAVWIGLLRSACATAIGAGACFSTATGTASSLP